MFISPHGKHVWVEFKRHGEEPEPLQTYRIRKLQERGVDAFWADDADITIANLKAVSNDTQ